MKAKPKPWSVPAEVVEHLNRNPWPVPSNLADLPPLLTQAQTALVLDCSQSTVRRLIAEEKLLAHRVGPRMIRVDRDSLIKLATSQVVGA